MDAVATGVVNVLTAGKEALVTSQLLAARTDVLVTVSAAIGIFVTANLATLELIVMKVPPNLCDVLETVWGTVSATALVNAGVPQTLKDSTAPYQHRDAQIIAQETVNACPLGRV